MEPQCYNHLNKVTVESKRILVRNIKQAFKHEYHCREAVRTASLEKSYRAISIARLYITVVHLQPINVVVFDDPQWKSNLEAGFALRCFQRLS